ncbi:hypothetical protein [Actinokineospora bangkokensis]|uniref:Uncharacterized protein n=1 Tax=Actinokineospora bangkokensis TaxID=1193682 RepID=A0A1Q9LDY7_9PSEU|nr:hypothetical protein [Actinokineospora bangkokensis]OLR90226.1 hypothetical protein BJP25_04525 [Actinokineospora bangkokensis]
MNPQVNPVLFTFKPESPHMLIHENLARSHTREAERVARERHLVRRLSAARRWSSLARWVQRRADRAVADL